MRPRRAEGRVTGPVGDVTALLGARAGHVGAGKILWVGGGSELGPSLIRPQSELQTSGIRGPLLSGVWPQGGVGPGIARSVASLEAGGTDRAGRDLRQWDIRFIVVDASRSEGAHQKRAWLAQRDLAVIREEPGYLLMGNVGAAPGPLP
jgi:hypothetical protein